MLLYYQVNNCLDRLFAEKFFYINIILFISEARAEIQGKDKEVIVKKGSSLELHCLVNKGEGVHESMAVFWYLNSK